MAWAKYMQDNHQGVLKEIKDAGAISDALDKQLGEICGSFVNRKRCTGYDLMLKGGKNGETRKGGVKER